MRYLLLCMILLFVLGLTLSEVDSDAAFSSAWSMLVSVRYDCQRTGDPTTHCCTGTILSESYVLTAARCVNQFDRGEMTIVAGAHKPFIREQMIRTVDRIIIHPNRASDQDRSKATIALLHLSNPLNFIDDEYIAPVSLFASGTLENNNRHFLMTSGNSMNMRSDRQIWGLARPIEIRLLDQKDPMCQRWAADADLQCYVALNHFPIGSCLHRRSRFKYTSSSLN